MHCSTVFYIIKKQRLFCVPEREEKGGGLAVNSKRDDSFHSVYVRNISRLIKMAYRITDSYEDAEDLADEACFIYWQKSQLAEVLNPDAYLAKIMANLLGNFLRSKKNEALPLEFAEEIAARPDAVSIKEYFPPGLLESEQEILILRIEKQLSYTEISQLLCLPESSCRSRFFRAKEHLKSLLTY